jgi:hypothetical protein
MACFTLTPKIAQLLASCIEIGFEGAEDNHTDTGGENSQEELDAIGDILAEIQAFAEKELTAEITIVAAGN